MYSNQNHNYENETVYSFIEGCSNLQKNVYNGMFFNTTDLQFFFFFLFTSMHFIRYSDLDIYIDDYIQTLTIQ